MLASSILAAALHIASATSGEFKIFRDWVVACDNGRSCEAMALLPENGPGIQRVMSIRRGPARSAPVKIVIQYVNARPARLSVDGVAFPARFGGEADISVRAQNPTALLKALHSARSLELFNRRGRSLATVSLNGAAASFRYMDEQQRRVGTVTALIAKGPAPASAVPPAPMLPRVRNAWVPGAAKLTVPRHQIENLHFLAKCDQGLDGVNAVETQPLEPGKTLLLVSCYGGAYNVTKLIFLVTRDGGQARIIRPEVEDFEPMSSGDLPMLRNVYWEDGALIERDVGRGVGDCGFQKVRVWDGSRFRLTKVERMEMCGGANNLITTYRAAVIGIAALPRSSASVSDADDGT